MINLTLKIVTLLFAVFFIFAYEVIETSAQSYDFCGNFRGKKVGDVARNYPGYYSQVPDSTFNGNFCDIPGQFNPNLSCIGSSGQRYMVYYCNPVLECPAGEDCSRVGCESEYPEPGGKAPAFCNRPDTGVQTDISRIFGEIFPPPAIQNFGFGALGISKFLSNLVVLIYSLAAIVLIFMLLWGAFEWLTSGGDKEKVAAARARLTYAFIGIILFAVAFAVIQVLGAFTGFKFFVGQH